MTITINIGNTEFGFLPPDVYGPAFGPRTYHERECSLFCFFIFWAELYVRFDRPHGGR